ncbi:non-ribosomal peptide synthetase [Leptolyngbya sp. NIES-2104]|uniref:non-ribosomal peptide synthetase n=1 Tax=Leptolyngbya sp. NIES-2104 TaxID=1552121 RepID=UPI0006ECA3E1|nr:non-ribosomal peptide synthetase [Leptolyngbya sp. NIES-2104]GAP99200.1 non-ribosomal peptide synthetase [Leptolyngbya sp. NIES-2104]
MQSLTAIHSSTQASVEYSLSWQQQGLWFLYQLDPESSAYNIYHTVRILGELDVAAWKQAWEQVFQAHAILRSRYGDANGTPFRVVRSGQIPLRSIQAIGWNESTLKAQILAETAKPFRLETEPAIRVCLFRCSAQECVQVITLHHIAGDMWTFDLLLEEWERAYQGKSVEVRSRSAVQASTYIDYVNWQREMMESDRAKELLNFWNNQLAGELPAIDLPSKSHPKTERSETQSFPLPDHLIEPLQPQGYSLYRILLTAFLVLLYRYTGESDLAIGSAMAGRWGTDWFRDVIGYFSNMVTLRIPIDGELGFETLLEQVDQIVRQAQTHQDLPLQELVKQKKTSRLFSVTFTWQKHRWIDRSFEGLTFEPYLLEHQGGATFDLDLQVVEAGDRFNLVWQYNANRFEAQMITRMAQQFETLLESVILNPQASISHLSILPAKQQHQLLIEWNRTAQPIPSQCVHELISAQAIRTPDAIAVQFNQDRLTYRELDQKSNQLARFLQAQGVQPGSLVGICMERSIDFIVGILGILKAGGAFVPLDPTYPKERLELLIEDAQVTLLLTSLGIDSFSTAPVHSPVQNHHLAYVIYTSGSTGKPKGVMIEHQSMVNHNLAAIREYELKECDRVLQASALSFDIAIEEIFPTLICGATLVLRSPDCLMSTQQFLQFVESHQITVLNLPTALWHQIVYGLTELDLVLPDAVRLVIVGGEKASRSTYLTWLERVGNYPRWINTYGPTEATVIATIYDPIRSGFDQGELSIGRAIANTQTYVLDAQMQPVPIGVAGELYIGGFGVARGYLRRPEQTQEKFIEHQFSELPPQRLYRTGDLVRYRSDGNLEYLGRNDDQVKIRGFRIELGEIEFALNQHPAITDSIVLAQSQRLIAYLVTQAPIADLQRFLKQLLPNYMIPSAFVELEAFPLTPNGKVDRKALQKIAPSISTRTIAPPETTLEHQLVQIWQEVLKIEPIGLDDDFFELGGHSLLMLQLAAKMEQALGQSIPMALLYQVPTIRQLSQAIDNEQADFSPNLIQFQAGNSNRSPLFCIPGATGTFRFCEGLRAHLDSEQPIYGIQELSIDSETTLEMMAGYTLREMRHLQPEGPYYLIGYSMGAAVAYEIAQQLYDQGQEVALLALIAPVNMMAIPKRFIVLQKLPVVRNFHLPLELLTRWNAFPVESRSLQFHDRTLLFFKKIIWSLKLVVRMTLFSAIDNLTGNTDPYWRHGRIVRRYRPRKSAFPIQLFICEEEAKPSEMWVSWRTLADDRLTVHILPGTHLSCVDKPTMKILVENIDHLLPK